MNTTTLPTKNNLIRIKEKLKLSNQGYDLLEKKRFILIIEKNKYIKQKEETEKKLEESIMEAYEKLKNAIIDVGIDDLINIADEINLKDNISIKYKTIMGVEIPSIISKESSTKLEYGLYNTTTSVDESVIDFIKIKDLIVKLAELDNTIVRLNKSILKVQKRSNALKDIIIPENKKLVEEIQNIIEEREREEFTRLKIIKRNM